MLWATILTRRLPPAARPAASIPPRPVYSLKPWARAVLLVFFVLLSPARGSAQAVGEQLSQLAQALRASPTAENYQRLEKFARDYAESELSARASFALGMTDYEQKRWSQARLRFREAQASRQLGDYAALYLARAEAELGAMEAALNTLQRFPFADTPLEETAVVLEAEILVRAERAGEAVARLKRHPAWKTRPALLFALGRALQAAGHELAAVEPLQRVYYEFPLSSEAEPSNQLLSQLRANLKRDYPAPSEALRHLRAQKLWERRAYRGARSAYLDLSVRAREPVRQEARLRAALALYNLGSRDAACAELGRAGEVPLPLEAEFRFYRVRCGLQAGNEARVEAELSVLAKQWRRTEWYEQALAAAGNTALSQGDTRRARAYYDRLAKALLSGDASEEAHWKLAWLTYREGERAQAARLMEEHLTRFPASRYRARALFWRARLAQQAGEHALAARLLARLREWAPRDYLSQLAERMDHDLPSALAVNDRNDPVWDVNPPRQLQPFEPRLLPLPVRLRLETASALQALGLWELAQDELVSMQGSTDRPEIHLAQARGALAQGKYARATETLNRAFPTYWRARLEELPQEAWEIMFPRPYWETITREARANGLDPYMVAALIRQESRFERDAVSSAGALGLMQLMPGTARGLAGTRSLSKQRILDPNLNIRLGTRFLAQLFRRFDGNVEKAIAGYNAGGTRVTEWASQGNYSEPAEFVESIPVTQTREFVYIILRNYRFYQDIYAQERSEAARAAAEAEP